LSTEPESRTDVSEKPNDRPCLLVILGPRLTLARDLQWPLKGFLVGNKQYLDAAFGEWTGFYDWLRDTDGNLLGVRYAPSEDTEFLIERVTNLSYVKADPSRDIEIYFSQKRTVDAKHSCDQAFLYDAIFHSDDGDYAIGFGIEELSETDIYTLEKAEAEWAAARPLE
jgi:hypothetical protein